MARRGKKIWSERQDLTCDPQTPSLMRYQAALRSDNSNGYFLAFPQLVGFNPPDTGFPNRLSVTNRIWGCRHAKSDRHEPLLRPMCQNENLSHILVKKRQKPMIEQNNGGRTNDQMCRNHTDLTKNKLFVALTNTIGMKNSSQQ